jgi:hypothetical protein
MIAFPSFSDRYGTEKKYLVGKRNKAGLGETKPGFVEMIPPNGEVWWNQIFRG